jgi:hypothetical protein
VLGGGSWAGRWDLAGGRGIRPTSVLFKSAQELALPCANGQGRTAMKVVCRASSSKAHGKHM